MKKNILLINDLPGYGKVALATIFPILSHMGYSVYNLPTALVSNTLDYGKFEILETTDYMRNTVGVGAVGFFFWMYCNRIHCLGRTGTADYRIYRETA